MKTADQHSGSPQRNPLILSGGLDSQIPRPRTQERCLCAKCAREEGGCTNEPEPMEEMCHFCLEYHCDSDPILAREGGRTFLRRLIRLLLRPLRTLVWLIRAVLIVLREVYS